MSKVGSSAMSASEAIAQRRSESLASIVLREMERMILSGELKAGERISEQNLALRLGVSRGPVREAASALERSGLLTSVANRGVFVRHVSTEELLELYDMRALLTGFACARLAERATAEQKAALRAMVEGLEAAHAAGDGAAYYQGNLDFHEALMTFAGHDKAARIYETLLKEAHLSRRGVLAAAPMMQESNTEHADIVAAIAAGDGPRAREAGERHVLNGKRRLLAKVGGGD
ncbi:methycitrate-responsive transcriptional regulator of methylisocitrate utilization PrpR [Allostella vacuolata]|nr:methycitrate-responsive transcriptional regulator of methylisocitrate utilization PrpR [Stella vacuolata]